MRILLIDVNCKFSSTGKIVYDLFSALKRDGHEAFICYGRGPVIHEAGIYKISSDTEVLFHAFLSRMTGLNGYFSFFSTRRLLRLIDEIKPDVVHIHDPKTYYMNIASMMEFLGRRGIPVVWTFHSEFMYTGKCGHAYDCNRWLESCGDCPAIRRYPKSLWFDFTRFMLREKKMGFQLLRKLVIASPSAWLAERARQSFLNGRDIRVIYNGIDTEIFHYAPLPLLHQKYAAAGEKIILAVAPDIMSDRKGGKWILELARKLPEGLRVIMIGALNPYYEAVPKDNITLLPVIRNQEELAGYYSMADVFVICSLKENFPTTCLEAQCCGTPVAGFDTGGTAETGVSDEFSAFVPYGGIPQLRNAVLGLLEKSSPERKKRLAQEAAQRYGRSVMYHQYLNVYTEIVK